MSIMNSMMTSIYFGYHIKEVLTLNAHSTIGQINEEIRNLFGNNLPNSYSILFYNEKRKKMVTLNQKELDSEYNPFQLSSPDNNPYEMTMPFVNLYIHENSFENADEDNLGIQSDRRNDIDHTDSSSLGSSTNILRVGNNQQDLTGNWSNNAHSNANYHDETPPVIDNNDQNPTSSMEIDSNEVSYLNNPINNIIVTETDQNISAPNNSREHVTISSHTTVPQYDPPNSIQNLMDHQRLTEPMHVQSDESTHLRFDRDVKPYQKKIFKSDEFNQKIRTKSNGFITRIQGVKTDEQKRTSVLPLLCIPTLYRNKNNTQLAVFVVSERFNNGTRILLKHRDKGFLPKNYTRDTPPINPIIFNLNEIALTNGNQFKLDLKMTSLWNKLQGEPEQVYKLDEQSTLNLHTAPHDPICPRLLCVLREGERYIENTICFSDFIRPPIKKNLK